MPSVCIEVKNETNRRYYARHRERLAEEKSQYRKDNPERESAAKRKYYTRNRDIVIAKVQKYNEDNPENRKRSPEQNHKRNLRRYNMSVADYNAMFQKQEGRCAICLKHQSEIKLRLYVDHDHETGKVRGLLCKPCNSVLGFACDETGTLQRAISYLEESRV